MAYEVLKINNQMTAQKNAMDLMQFIGDAFKDADLYMRDDISAFFKAWSGNDALNGVYVFINRSESGIIDQAILTHVANNPLIIKPPIAYDFIRVNASDGLNEFRDTIIGALD